MKYLRWLTVLILIVIMGYLSAVGLFADSGGISGTISLILVFLAGCAGVGALIPTRWQLSVLCSWGAVILTTLELAYSIGKDPIAGQQPTVQVIFIGLGTIALALFGGYVGSRLHRFM